MGPASQIQTQTKRVLKRRYSYSRKTNALIDSISQNPPILRRINDAGNNAQQYQKQSGQPSLGSGRIRKFRFGNAKEKLRYIAPFHNLEPRFDKLLNIN